MGMYTEIFFRAAVDPKLVPFLTKWIEEGYYDYFGGGTDEWIPDPDHEFFKCDRWISLAGDNDSYFPMAYGAKLSQPFTFDSDHWVLSLHTCIKNYDSEYEKFFKWIDPYIMESKGDFIGYTLYEESTAPTLHHSSGEGYRRKYGE